MTNKKCFAYLYAAAFPFAAEDKIITFAPRAEEKGQKRQMAIGQVLFVVDAQQKRRCRRTVRQAYRSGRGKS